MKFVPRALHLVWQAAGAWGLVWLLLLAAQGFLPAGLVYLTRLLVDEVSGALSQSSWSSLQAILWPALLMALLALLRLIIENGLSWVRIVLAEHVSDHLAVLIHQRSANVDLAFYETPDFHDQLQRARDDALYLPLELLESIGTLLENAITFVGMSFLLLPYGWWLPLALGASTLPAFLVILRNHALLHRWWEAATVQQRWAKYYDTVLTLEDSAAEVRLFNLGPYYSTAYQAVRKSLREGRIAIARRQHWAQFLAGVWGLLLSALIALWVLWRASQARYTLGDLALLYQAFSQGQSLLHALLGSVGRIYRHMLFLGNLFEFLDLQPQVIEPSRPRSLPQPLQQGIHFENVTFCYPGSTRPALQNFTLTIPAGRTVAIVGENGAGKSTLVKLLCRFYDPVAGSITLDDVDLRQLATRELRDNLSVMFQTPVPYHATAAENIAVGQTSQSLDPAAVEEAARAAGVHEIIMGLPQGYATLLGKWFVDGTGLSGGEWQRVALARAFLRQTDLILLDEPTSAMDSWAEAEWLDRFRALVYQRTAIIITHRFTTAMRADLIFVMQAGQIVESGSHHELLAQNGLYATSWRRQIDDTQLLSRNGHSAQAQLY
ncbi:MAG: ABC transporter ATP-binding protein [Caldilineaceae bacterium]